MHTCNNYKFETESSAIEFAANQRANKCPSEDKYVSGPVFMDENQIFKSMPWANTGKTWWQVTVEIYR
jgi:hypothetical protein